jgi:hypothetical protein
VNTKYGYQVGWRRSGVVKVATCKFLNCGKKHFVLGDKSFKTEKPWIFLKGGCEMFAVVL